MHFNMFNCFLLSLFWGLDGPVMIGTELFLLTGHQSQQRAVGHGTRMSGGLGRVLSCTSLAEVGCKVCLQGLEPNLSASVKPKPHARALKMDQGGGGGGVSQDLSVCSFPSVATQSTEDREFFLLLLISEISPRGQNLACECGQLPGSGPNNSINEKIPAATSSQRP